MTDLARVSQALIKEASSRQRYCKFCGSRVPHNSSCERYADHNIIVEDSVVDVQPFALPHQRGPKVVVPPAEGHSRDAVIPDSGTEVVDIKTMAEYLKTGVCRDKSINRTVQEYVSAVKANFRKKDTEGSAFRAGLGPMLLAQRVCLTVILMAEKELGSTGSVIDTDGEPRGIVKFLSSYLTCFRNGQQSLGLLARARAQSAKPASLSDIESEYGKKNQDEEED